MRFPLSVLMVNGFGEKVYSKPATGVIDREQRMSQGRCLRAIYQLQHWNAPGHSKKGTKGNVCTVYKGYQWVSVCTVYAGHTIRMRGVAASITRMDTGSPIMP